MPETKLANHMYIFLAFSVRKITYLQIDLLNFVTYVKYQYTKCKHEIDTKLYSIQYNTAQIQINLPTEKYIVYWAIF